MNKPEHMEPPSEYFAFAAKLAKAQAAQVLADIAKREATVAAKKLAAAELDSDPVIARMLQSFAKQREISNRDRAEFADERTQAEIDAEANALFNRAELGGIRGML